MRLPPLESLRFFEAAARQESFARAAEELCVTPAAVAHRIKMLERHLGARLFVRHYRGVHLNGRGKAYFMEVHRILGDVHRTTERVRSSPAAMHLRIVSMEVFAEKWLMPRLARFHKRYPGITLDLHTDHRDINLLEQEHDVWITYRDTVPGGLITETLFEEFLLPVSSPGLLGRQGQPRAPAELLSWPLLYDLHWAEDWAEWSANHGASAPDLSRASGFRLYSMLIRAAVDGIGAAVGHTSMIAEELERGMLVPLFDEAVPARNRFLVATLRESGQREPIRAFREWILAEARSGPGFAAHAGGKA